MTFSELGVQTMGLGEMVLKGKEHSLLYLFIYLFILFYWLGQALVMWDLVPPSGIKPGALHWEPLDHQEVLLLWILNTQ